jgi:hypothetical protein
MKHIEAKKGEFRGLEAVQGRAKAFFLTTWQPQAFGNNWIPKTVVPLIIVRQVRNEIGQNLVSDNVCRFFIGSYLNQSLEAWITLDTET